MPYMVHAVKDGQTIESLKASPLTAIARARLLMAEGWPVQITENQSQIFGPAEFNCLWRRVKHPLDLAVQSAHDADTSEHRRGVTVEICSTLLNIADQTLKTFAGADAKSAPTLVHIGSDDHQFALLCI